MNKYRRVPAYTIMELTVAMLLSAIVIGITYTAYSLISRYYLSYQTRHNEMAVLIRLDELLQKDIARADDMVQENGDLTMSMGNRTISYHFNPDQIIRISTIRDTFNVAGGDVAMIFENERLPTYAEQGRIDELSFTIRFKNENFPYHYFKQYSSENLIKPTVHALH